MPGTPEVARGHLRILLGAAPGVGKTYAMLEEGQHLAGQGVDVVVALAETHHREATEARLRDLEVVPTKAVSHRGSSFEELDVDAVLERRPGAALVDELAHTNVPGGRRAKRWEDVEVLLEAGIDVITTLNIQHVDSLNDAVEAITGVAQDETVPDIVVAAAESIELLETDPEVLRTRIAAGEVLQSGAASAALAGYYSAENLAALRDLAIEWLDERGLLGPSLRAGVAPGSRVPRTGERVVAALTGAPEGEHVLRRAAQIARSIGGELVGVHVRSPSALADPEPPWLVGQRRLLAELGGRFAEIAAVDVASAVLDFARNEHAHQLVLGATRRSRIQELLHGSVINRAIRHAGLVEVHVVPARRPPVTTERGLGARTRRERVPLPLRRRQLAWVLAVVAPAAVTLVLAPFHASIGLAGALFLALVTVVGVAALGGIAPATLATVVGFLLADFFYAVPLYSLRVDRLIELVALVAYAAVAVVVGLLVDVLARQGLQTARVQAEAESLARLVAAEVASSPEALEALLLRLRRTFDLSAASVLRPTPSGWQVDAAVGEPAPGRPEDATHAAELPDRRVLALVAATLAPPDRSLLEAFVSELTLERERTLLG